MADKQPVTIELYPQQLTYLEQMAAQYDIPDLGKAMRILIDFARDEPSQESLIFAEKRCKSCGRAASSSGS